jgi:hypothetical protein
VAGIAISVTSVMDKEYPSTLASMNNLAGVLNEPGAKYEQAEERHRVTAWDTTNRIQQQRVLYQKCRWRGL